METKSINPEQALPPKFLAKLQELGSLQRANGEANKQLRAFSMHQFTTEGKLDDKFTKEDSEAYKNFMKKTLVGQVLDVASGPTHELADYIPDNQVTYLDSDPKRVPKSGGVLGDAGNLPFQNNGFDTIFTRAFIHGIGPEDGKHLAEMVRVLKPNGKILILGSANLEGVLKTIADIGISLEDQCEMEVINNSVTHEASAIKLNSPEAIIVVQPK